MRKTRRDAGDITAIYVHAGAGFHSYQNEKAHLKACSDAATVAMTMLKNGCSAVDAVELAIKVLEDREITNSGFGSNLAMDGAVECDATMVDHYGRSGACGAVSQIRNPISLARKILDYSTKPMALQRVPPNLLVAQGATDFAFEHNFPILPHDYLISSGARERWLKWKRDLETAEQHLIEQRTEEMDLTQEKHRRRALDSPQPFDSDDITLATTTTSPPPPSYSAAIDFANLPPPMKPLVASAADTPEPSSPLIDTSDYTDHPPLALKDLPNFRPLHRSPLSQVVQQDGSGRPTAERPDSMTIDSAALGNGSPQKRNRGQDGSEDYTVSCDEEEEGNKSPSKRSRREDSYEDSNRSPKSPKSLELPEETSSPLLFPTNPHVDCFPFPSRPAPTAVDETTASAKPPLLVPLPEITIRRASSINPDHIPSEDAVFAGKVAEDVKGFKDNKEPKQPNKDSRADDWITDTVGAIAVDCYGNIAAGSSSGGIGMKHRGRTGPAALVGIGTAVVPVDPDDHDRASVAVVTSGTGEHMATTMAAATAADRIYNSVRRKKGGLLEECTEDDAIQAMIEHEFMNHPGVRNSPCVGAIGIMAVKTMRDGVYLYFAHNTDSFAIASMSSEDKKPALTMSRNEYPGMITTGGRSSRWRQRS